MPAASDDKAQGEHRSRGDWQRLRADPAAARQYLRRHGFTEAQARRVLFQRWRYEQGRLTETPT
jgi:hypothetical protein